MENANTVEDTYKTSFQKDKESKFVGLFISKEILEEVKNGKLNSSEFLLLSFIVAFSHEKGCFASNKYLGEQLNLSSGTITNIITSLKNKGFVKQLSFDGHKRYLGTKF